MKNVLLGLYAFFFGMYFQMKNPDEIKQQMELTKNCNYGIAIFLILR